MQFDDTPDCRLVRSLINSTEADCVTLRSFVPEPWRLCISDLWVRSSPPAASAKSDESGLLKRGFVLIRGFCSLAVVIVQHYNTERSIEEMS